MREKERGPRHAVSFDTRVLGEFDRARGAWYESPAEVRRGLDWGRRKRALLQWVRLQMVLELTERERHCVELHYFEDLTYAEMAVRTHTNPSSTFRAVQRALRKLRAAAQEDASWQAWYRVKRRR